MLKTEHQGYQIAYSENRDLWTCTELDLEDVSLAKLRAKINKVQLQARKEAATDVLVLGFRGKSIPGKAIDAKRAHRRGEMGDELMIGVMAERGFNEKPSKRWESLSDLAMPTPETFAAIEEALAATRAVQKASARAKEAWSRIPRATEADLAELIAAADQLGRE